MPFFYKDSFGIKLSTKVVIPLNTETNNKTELAGAANLYKRNTGQGATGRKSDLLRIM